MALAFNQTGLTYTTPSAVNPTDDFSVQVEFEAGSTAYVDVLGQVDAAASPAAPYVSLGTISALDSPPIKRFAKCPNVKFALTNNNGGKYARVWWA